MKTYSPKRKIGSIMQQHNHFHLFQSPDEWDMNDVLVWLAATNHFLYAEIFREHEITGIQLRDLTTTSLDQINITDSFHKQSILLAIQELFTGESETVSVSCTIVHYIVQLYITMYKCNIQYLYLTSDLCLLHAHQLTRSHFTDYHLPELFVAHQGQTALQLL